MLLTLPKGDFHQEAENMHDWLFEVMLKERMHYNDNRSRKAQTPLKRCK